MSLKVSYDAEHDLFNVSENAIQVDIIEVYPGISLGLDSDDTLVGVEVWAQARKLLGTAIEPLVPVGSVRRLPLKGSLADLDAQLRPTDGSDFLRLPGPSVGTRTQPPRSPQNPANPPRRHRRPAGASQGRGADKLMSGPLILRNIREESAERYELTGYTSPV